MPVRNETQLQTETNHCKLLTNFDLYWYLLTYTVTSLHRSEYKHIPFFSTYAQQNASNFF